MPDFHPMPTDPRFRNLAGHRFGRWTVLGYAGKPGPRKHAWHCRCACGTLAVILTANLGRSSHSCGCLRVELYRIQRLTHGCSRWKKGRTPEYETWLRMRSRCNAITNPDYAHYGGRGITVCQHWDSFEAFLADMGPRPSGRHSLDRIDTDGPYAPSNCRWATQTEQMRNTRVNHLVTFQGRTQCLQAWAEELGILQSTLWIRLRRWPVERALTTPVRPLKRRG